MVVWLLGFKRGKHEKKTDLKKKKNESTLWKVEALVPT
jgi:hypothetical protein